MNIVLLKFRPITISLHLKEGHQCATSSNPLSVNWPCSAWWCSVMYARNPALRLTPTNCNCYSYQAFHVSHFLFASTNSGPLSEKRRPIHPNATMTDQGHREAIRPVGDTFNVDPHGPSSFSPRPNHRNMPPTMPQRLPTQEDFASQARQGLTADNMQRHIHQSPSSQQNFVW